VNSSQINSVQFQPGRPKQVSNKVFQSETQSWFHGLSQSSSTARQTLCGTWRNKAPLRAETPLWWIESPTSMPPTCWSNCQPGVSARVGTKNTLQESLHDEWVCFYILDEQLCKFEGLGYVELGVLSSLLFTEDASMVPWWWWNRHIQHTHIETQKNEIGASNGHAVRRTIGLVTSIIPYSTRLDLYCIYKRMLYLQENPLSHDRLSQINGVLSVVLGVILLANTT
jgi:hypothetical protein